MPQEEKLGKGDASASQFPDQVRHETTLHHHDDVGQGADFLLVERFLGGGCHHGSWFILNL
jgi:hypothetical protein